MPKRSAMKRTSIEMVAPKSRGPFEGADSENDTRVIPCQTS